MRASKPAKGKAELVLPRDARCTAVHLFFDAASSAGLDLEANHFAIRDVAGRVLASGGLYLARALTRVVRPGLALDGLWLTIPLDLHLLCARFPHSAYPAEATRRLSVEPAGGWETADYWVAADYHFEEAQALELAATERRLPAGQTKLVERGVVAWLLRQPAGDPIQAAEVYERRALRVDRLAYGGDWALAKAANEAALPLALAPAGDVVALINEDLVGETELRLRVSPAAEVTCLAVGTPPPKL